MWHAWKRVVGRQTHLDLISVARCQLCCPVDGFLPARTPFEGRMSVRYALDRGWASLAPVNVFRPLRRVGSPTERIYTRRL
jgi:hypothetical protein